MIAYYEITKALNDHLQADAEINTIAVDGLDNIDVVKQSIYGIAHIDVDNAIFIKGTIRFNVDIAVMDIVDERKNDIRDMPAAERWKGIDNKQDVLNTMLSVIERLDKKLRHETLIDGWSLVGDVSATKFERKYENMLTGWLASFTIEVPNTIQNCP